MGFTRRTFVRTAASGLLVFGGGHRATFAGSAPTAVLSGTEFDLQIASMTVSPNGNAREATVVNGQIPGPLLRWREGDTVTLRVSNRLASRSSIHWHGLIVPADMDGVPGISFDGIAPGQTYTYRFKVNQHGTYWYHAHSRFQEQTGLYGPIVIEPRERERHHADREHVLLLSDWTDIDPERIFATLKKQSDYFNFHQRTAGDFVQNVRKNGWRETVADRRMWGEMRMNPTDIADVSGYAYTYLMNGAAPGGNWTGLFAPGERVRLRMINGSAMSIFDVRIPGLKLTVVAADGQDVEPVTVDELRIATAETYDVIVQPEDRVYTVFAQAMDRSGYTRGTLTPRVGLEAPVPAMDPAPRLTMTDMGMAHGPATTNDASSMDHSSMDHSSMAHSSMAHSSMNHESASGPVRPLESHAAAEFGATVDSRADQVYTRLDDPGVGLRNNGRRVLTYGDLHTIGGAIDEREPAREIELHLTGHMERFIWSFSGQKFSEAEPLRFQAGERLRIVLVNDTMMTHPIHLHGMWSEVESPDGKFQVRKHTVTVNPAQQVSYAVTADALGRWAYHCHLLYHMEAGMFREVIVAHAGAPSNPHPGHRG